MTVKVSVGADVDPAVAALKKIESAAKDAAGGNKELADAVGRVNSQFEEAKKVSPGFRDALKNTGQLNKSIIEVDWGKLSTNPKVASNQRSKIVNYATAGTGFEPPSSGSGGKGGSGFGGIPIPGIGGMLKGVLALAGIGGMASMASKSVQLGQANAGNVENLVRASDTLAQDFDSVSNDVRGIGVGLGVATVEAGRLAKTFSQLAGETKIATAAEHARNAIALSKGFGIDHNVGVRSMGKMDWMMGGKMQQKELGLIIADAIVSGNMFSKGDEVMGAIERFIESSERVLVNPPDVGAYAALKAVMDSNKSAPGLRGQGAENALNRINQGIQNPGAGDAGDYFMYRAMGQGLDIGRFEYLKESGMFGSMANQGLGGDQQHNLAKVMSRLKMEMPDKFMRAMSMKKLFGLSMHQSMGFEKLYNKINPGEQSDFMQTMSESGIDLSKVSSGVYGEFGKIFNKGLSKDKTIAAMKKVASDNIAETEGSKMIESNARIESELTAVGNKLIIPLNAIKESTADLLTAFRTVNAKDLGIDAGGMFNFLGFNKSQRPPSSSAIDNFAGGKAPVVQPSSTAESRRVEFGEATITLKDERGKVLQGVRMRPFEAPGAAAAQ